MPTRSDITIALVGPFPPPAGGMAVQARRLAAGLRADGVRVIEAPTNPPWPAILRPLRHVPFVRTAITALLFRRRLRRAVRKADLFHVLACSYLNFGLFTVPTLKRAHRRGTPVVVNYRGGHAERFFSNRPRALRWLKRADALSVPSGFLRDVFDRFGLDAVIVSNIAELDRFAYRDRTEIAPHIVVTRHLEPWYNVGLAVRAFERVRAARPQATLTIAGGGSERAALAALVAERGIEGVTFLGPVPNDEMPDLLARCDLALNPTNVDNMPISVLEAYASGLPVVSTNVGGVPYIVTDGETGFLVPPDDEQAMADRILWACDHPAEAREAARRGRERCTQYTWPVVREALWAVYEGVLAGVGPGGAL